MSSGRFEALHRERDNFRAALAWADGTPAFTRLAGALDPYLVPPTPSPRRSRSTSRALEIARGGRPRTSPAPSSRWARSCRSPTPRGRSTRRARRSRTYAAQGDRRRIALALLRLSNSRSWTADEPEGYALAEQALEHARATGDRALEGYALTQMAIGSVDIEHGLPLLEAGLEALRHAGAVNRIPGALSTVAFGLLRLGAYDEAEALHRQAVYAVNQTRSRVSDRTGGGQPRADALLRGAYDEAREGFVAQLRIAHARTLTTFYFEAFLGLGAVAASTGEDERAATLEAAAWTHIDRPPTAAEEPVYTRVTEQFLAPARERLGSEATAVAAERGRTTALDDLVSLALRRARVARSSTAGRGSRRRAG